MHAEMASCSSSLALSRWHPLSCRTPRGGRLRYRCQAVAFRDNPGLKWAAARSCSRRVTVMASASGSENSTHSSNDGGAPVVQPRRKRGRPTKAESTSQAEELGATEEEEEEEEEWDFFGELESHIENESRKGWPGLEAPKATEAEVVAPSSNGIVIESGESVPVAASPSFGGRQESGEEDAIGDEDEDIDYDDPKYEQKPDWMEDAVWQAIKNQAPGDEDDEGQPLWVDEDDPTWPEEGPEDGWGFRTSQFFDKVSIKNDKSAEDDGEDDEALQMNWDSEADDWTIKEITANDWEYNVFADPSPLIVYAFARYGRSGMDSWKMLEQLEKAVTSVWESAKAPLRAVKVDIGMEIDLGSALGISKDECPQLLFIKNGKGLYRLQDQRTSEELVQLLAHFFYNGKRPSFLKTTSSPESLKSVA